MSTRDNLLQAGIVLGITAIILGIVFFVFFVARSKPAMFTAPTDNSAIAVEQLFTHDGCSVYRFRDAGYPRYYVRCANGSGTSWGETHSTGKSSYQVPMEVHTQ